MIRAAFAWMLCLWAGPALSGSVPEGAVVVDVPSQEEVWLQEVLADDTSGAMVYRYRFVMPNLRAAQLDFDGLGADLQSLCDTVALPAMRAQAAEVEQIVISVSEVESEFGVMDPDVAQVFELFVPGEDACIWEMF